VNDDAVVVGDAVDNAVVDDAVVVDYDAVVVADYDADYDADDVKVMEVFFEQIACSLPWGQWNYCGLVKEQTKMCHEDAVHPPSIVS
jgi:hypothetical protein